jgi:hypothetical protein
MVLAVLDFGSTRHVSSTDFELYNLLFALLVAVP